MHTYDLHVTHENGTRRSEALTCRLEELAERALQVMQRSDAASLEVRLQGARLFAIEGRPA